MSDVQLRQSGVWWTRITAVIVIATTVIILIIEILIVLENKKIHDGNNQKKSRMTLIRRCSLQTRAPQLQTSLPYLHEHRKRLRRNLGVSQSPKGFYRLWVGSIKEIVVFWGYIGVPRFGETTSYSIES